MKKFSRKLKILLALILIFIGWIFLAPLLAGFLVVEKPLAKADAIWVLGGSSEFKERSQKAAELYRQGVSKKIFIVDDKVKSGWNAKEERNIPFFELSQRELVAGGVAGDSIDVVKLADDGTIYEARAFVEKNNGNQIKSVILVTSDYHTRRALWTFEHMIARNNFVTEIGVIKVTGESENPTRFFWWLSVNGWEKIAGEYVKSIYYYMFL